MVENTDKELMKYYGKPIITITNKHVVSCGEPPAIKRGKDEYLGYFENNYGEQAFFILNYTTMECYIRMGDAGWDNVYDVYDCEGVPYAVGLVMGDEEQAWLEVCFDTAYGHSKDYFNRDGRSIARVNLSDIRWFRGQVAKIADPKVVKATGLLAKYPGQWIGILNKKVLAQAETKPELKAKLREQGIWDIYIVRVPDLEKILQSMKNWKSPSNEESK